MRLQDEPAFLAAASSLNIPLQLLSLSPTPVSEYRSKDLLLLGHDLREGLGGLESASSAPSV